jgi:type VI secretion system secreted protein VgrG
MERNIIIHTPFGEDIKFRAFWGEEALSSLFEFSVEMQSDSRDLAAPDILGQSVTIEIKALNGASRYLNGQCAQFEYTEVNETVSHLTSNSYTSKQLTRI